LIVRDEADYGAAVAAEVLGLPHATVVVLGAGGFVRRQDIEAPLAQLRASFGIAAGDGVAALHRYLTLNPFPPSFRDPSDPLPGPVMAYRQKSPPRSAAEDAFRVYITLGTIFNTESGDLLARTVRAVAAASAVDGVIVATGEHVDPAELGPLPNQVVAERFVAQRDVLAGCSAVVSHAGSGTVLDALQHGLPQVCLPLGGDQTLNARRCAELGSGIVLAAGTATHDDIIRAVNDAVTVPKYRRAAERLQAEILDFPELDAAVSALEALCQRSAA
jgi:UDP:flavonoid glycosyltransferase YjiC (YdhE family)